MVYNLKPMKLMNRESRHTPEFPHSSITEASTVGRVVINESIFPWIVAPQQADIVRVTIDNTVSYLFASAISPDLTRLANIARQQYESAIDQMTFEIARRLALKDFTSLPKLKEAREGLNIHYGKSRHIRVYCAHIPTSSFPNLPDKLQVYDNIIIRIAACLKPHETQVHRAISTQLRKI